MQRKRAEVNHKRIMKIAVYAGEIPSTTFIERLIKGLSKNGATVFLFGYQKKKTKYLKNVRLKGYTANRLLKLCLLFKYNGLLFLFKRHEKKKLDQWGKATGRNKALHKLKYYPVLWYKPDIFHLQWAKGIEDWMWVQEFGIKLVLSLRGTHITIAPITNEKWATDYFTYFPKLDGFHAVSLSTAQAARTYGASDSKIKVIYSGLDLTKLPFLVTNKSGNELKIISIGRAHWVKGYSYALDVMALLQQENFDFYYTIIGVQNDEELLFQRAQLQLEEKVIFEDNLPFGTVVNKIKEADILLLSSVEEGIANVVLEAMALGTLVVTTNCGGMGEVVKDGENGFIVPARDVQAMVTAIKKASLLSERSHLTMVEKARKTIEEQYNESLMVSGMLDLYEAVSNQKELL